MSLGTYYIPEPQEPGRCKAERLLHSKKGVSNGLQLNQCKNVDTKKKVRHLSQKRNYRGYGISRWSHRQQMAAELLIDGVKNKLL